MVGVDFCASGVALLYFWKAKIRFSRQDFFSICFFFYLFTLILTRLLLLHSLEKGKEGRVSSESSPRLWRSVRDGATGEFEAKKVAELSNPGEIFKFHGQLYKLKEGRLIPCSAEETFKAKMQNL